jgi:hypothetical protein
MMQQSKNVKSRRFLEYKDKRFNILSFNQKCIKARLESRIISKKRGIFPPGIIQFMLKHITKKLKL